MVWDGVVHGVQWSGRLRRCLTMLVAMWLVSMRVRAKWCVARWARSAMVQCRGGVSKCTQCRACSCAARGLSECVRAETRVAILASMARARHGQGEGCGGAYGRSGRLAMIGQRRRWPEDSNGEAATGGLPSMPLSPWACSWSASA
jgi:hypothetical protein